MSKQFIFDVPSRAPRSARKLRTCGRRLTSTWSDSLCSGVIDMDSLVWSVAVSDGGAHHDRWAMDGERAVQKEAEDDDFILHEKVGSKVNFAL